MRIGNPVGQAQARRTTVDPGTLKTLRATRQEPAGISGLPATNAVVKDWSAQLNVTDDPTLKLKSPSSSWQLPWGPSAEEKVLLAGPLMLKNAPVTAATTAAIDAMKSKILAAGEGYPEHVRALASALMLKAPGTFENVVRTKGGNASNPAEVFTEAYTFASFHVATYFTKNLPPVAPG